MTARSATIHLSAGSASGDGQRQCRLSPVPSSHSVGFEIHHFGTCAPVHLSLLTLAQRCASFRCHMGRGRPPPPAPAGDGKAPTLARSRWGRESAAHSGASLRCGGRACCSVRCVAWVRRQGNDDLACHDVYDPRFDISHYPSTLPRCAQRPRHIAHTHTSASAICGAAAPIHTTERSRKRKHST